MALVFVVVNLFFVSSVAVSENNFNENSFFELFSSNLLEQITRITENSTCSLNLPDGIVNITAHYIALGAYHFKIDLESENFSVLTYKGWCFDYGTNMPTEINISARLYSSLNPPNYLKNENWSYINYIINHKPAGYNYLDIQIAMWYFINLGPVHSINTPLAQILINDALANGTNYVPGVGDLVAIIIDPVNNNGTVGGHKIQYTFMEMGCRERIHYCGDGVLDEGEECDDGNLNNLDDCKNDCTKKECLLDEDKDCVCDDKDLCLNSMSGEMVDANGCDPFQFCRQFNCGSLCYNADFIPKYLNCELIKGEPEGEHLMDCTAIVVSKEGSFFLSAFH